MIIVTKIDFSDGVAFAKRIAVTVRVFGRKLLCMGRDRSHYGKGCSLAGLLLWVIHSLVHSLGSHMFYDGWRQECQF